MEYVNAKKLIRSKSGFRIVSANNDNPSPFLLSEPTWTPDSQSTHCTECKSKFGFTLRRHHCRRCGNVFCSTCCHTRLPLPRMSFIDPVRLCERCASCTNREREFFDQHLKVLTNGAIFILDSPDLKKMEYLKCRLTFDHRYLQFQGSDIEPVDFSLIKSLHVSEESDPFGGCSVKMVFLKSKEGIEHELTFSTGPERHREMASMWLASMRQALKMANDIRGEAYN